MSPAAVTPSSLRPANGTVNDTFMINLIMEDTENKEQHAMHFIPRLAPEAVRAAISAAMSFHE